MTFGIGRRDLLLGAGAAIAAQPALARGVAPDLLPTLARQFGIPGVSVGIRTAEREDGLFAGMAALPFGVPVGPDTLFHIGSNSKHVTAIAILRLVQAGKLSLGTRIGDVLENLPVDWRDRRVSSLLSHTSGLPEYEDDFAWDRDVDHAGFLRFFRDPRPWFEEGETWSYCNTGYVLLGWVIEALTGRSYRAVVEDDILRPLALPHARIDDAAAVIPGRAEPYDLRGPEPRHAVRMAPGISGWPDGGLLFSARDFPLWDRALSGGKLLPGRDALVRWTALSTGRRVPYGMGFFLDRLVGRPTSWHGGRVPGFVSCYLRGPDDLFGVLVLTNGSTRSSAPQRIIGQSIAEALLPGSTVRSLRPIADAHSLLTKQALQVLARGSPDVQPDRLSPELRALQRRPGGTTELPRLSSDQPVQLIPVEEFTESGGLFRRYRIAYADRIEHVMFGYTPDERIFWGLGH